uniref:hypothetical protein n=1 Tax=Halalkalirubrum salinum TaxID=2563889 RepID=UPI0014858BAE|nr:hypothetical protein [Halalkalirubrum salinum]
MDVEAGCAAFAKSNQRVTRCAAVYAIVLIAVDSAEIGGYMAVAVLTAVRMIRITDSGAVGFFSDPPSPN